MFSEIIGFYDFLRYLSISLIFFETLKLFYAFYSPFKDLGYNSLWPVGHFWLLFWSKSQRANKRPSTDPTF